MAKVRWSSSAQEDMKMIYDHISIDSEFHALKFTDKLFERTLILATQPQTGKIVSEFNDVSIREVIEPPYRIIYKVVSEEEISIVRVHHRARILKKL